MTSFLVTLRCALGIVLTILCVLFVEPLFSDQSGTVAVIYPDLGSSYNIVFESMADGISEEFESPIQRIKLPENYSSAELKRRLSVSDTHGIIALGRRGLDASRAIAWRGPLVVSGVVWDASVDLDPKKVSAISLEPSPSIILGNLRQIAPHVKRVHTIVNAEQSDWFMDRARSAATELGITLLVKEVHTRQEAAIAYRDLLNRIDPSVESLWLSLEPIDEDTLKLILTTAWSRHFAVFSSNADHAKRGALYSVIPEYAKIGRHLGGMLAEQMHSGTFAGVLPNSHLRLAVNLRTAQHLGIVYSQATLGKFEVVYK